MITSDLLLLAQKHQVRLWPEDGRLRYRAPRGGVSEELRTIFSAHREQLIGELGGGPDGAAPFPMSHNQLSLWMLHQMVPESAAYTVVAACRVRGEVDKPALARAVGAVALRHEALRTTYGFWPDGSGPCQYVHERLEPDFRLIDARDRDDGALREEVITWMREPFSLARGPLLRACLFSQARERHVLSIAVHHIACDTRSVAIYLADLLRAYASREGGQALPAQPGGMSYRDFTLRQHELLAGEQGARFLSWWREALGGMPDALRLPIDFPRPARQRLRGASIFFEVQPRKYQESRAAAAAAGATPAAFLLAAYGRMLMRQAGQSDFGIAAAASGRTRPDEMAVCGYCVSPVVIRCRLKRGLTCGGYIGEISSRLLGALDHQQYPLTLLVEKLGPRRHAGRQPLAQALFNFAGRQILGILESFWCPSGEALRAGSLELTPYPLPQQEGQYELALDILEDGGGLFCALRYDDALFSRRSAESMVESYREALSELSGSPHAKIDLPAPGIGATAAPDPAPPGGTASPAVIDLPADLPRTAAPAGLAREFEAVRLDQPDMSILNNAARRCGCRWQTLACAACAALLQRLTGASAVAFAAAEGGQGTRRVELSIPPDMTFAGLVNECSREASPGAPPAATVLFATGDDAGQEDLPEGCELHITVRPSGESALMARFSYLPGLFTAETIRLWISAYALLLQGGAAHPGSPVWELPVMSAETMKKVVRLWNETDRAYAAAKNLSALIDRQVARTPWAPALKMDGHEITYTELGLRAASLAARLQQCGVGPDSPVGICAWRSVEMVIALVAVLKAGGAYVPLDPGLPGTRLAAMLEDCRPPVILAQESCRERLPEYAGARTIILGGGADQPDGGRSRLPAAVRLGRDNLAYIIFTSGSTGKPKGAMNTHGGICNRLLWMQQQYQLTSADRVLQKTPFGFDVSVWEFFWPLITGACLVVSPPGAHRDPAQVKRLIQTERISVIHFVPSMLRLFLDDETPADLSSLRHVICSGEALPAELQRLFFRRMPGSVRLHNLYGPTEAAVDVSYWECRRNDGRPFVPIGRPIANTQLYILDGRLKPVLPGVAGELHIGGAGLARGYINNRTLTDEKFIASPFSLSGRQRLYKTGDRARHLPDGSIDYLGRLDRQVKLRGCRIELGEIEAALYRHGRVTSAAAEVCRDDMGQERLVAYVAPAPGEQLQTESVRQFLRQQVPEYMVPDLFVVLDRLPLSANGKIDRRELPPPDWKGGSAPASAAPKTDMEGRIASVWKHVLRIGRVGTRDNFFDIGGNSLLLIKACRQLERELGRTISLTTLFEFPTIAGLAAHFGSEAKKGPVQRRPPSRASAARRPGSLSAGEAYEP